MKIGLPEELLPFEWIAELKKDIEHAAPEVEWSHAPARSDILNTVMLSEGDACQPFKSMIRTSLGLMGSVDKLLLPRLVRLDGHLMCPNFRALPDIVALNRDRLLGPEFNRPIIDTIVDISNLKQQNATVGQIITDLTGKKWHAPKSSPAKAAPEKNHPLPNSDNTIALLGHPYLLADRKLNMGVPKLLKASGLDVVTAQDIPFRELDELAASQDYYAKTMYWREARESLGAFFYFTTKFKPKGIIYMVSFNCGVDALVRIELMSLHKQLTDKIPFMILVGDEHTQQEHTATRLEAFLDIINGITNN